jgi:hypothetical protein
VFASERHNLQAAARRLRATALYVLRVDRRHLAGHERGNGRVESGLLGQAQGDRPMTDEVRRLQDLASLAARDNTPEARFASVASAAAGLKEDGLVLLVWVRNTSSGSATIVQLEGHGNEDKVLRVVDAALSIAEDFFTPPKSIHLGTFREVLRRAAIGRFSPLAAIQAIREFIGNILRRYHG